MNIKHNMKILFWNAQSIRNKKHEFLQLLQDNRIHVALINETHLNTNDKFTLRNYKVHRSDRVNRRGGGTAIAIHKSIQHTAIPLTQLQRTEATAVRIIVDNKPITLIAVYNPPGDISVDEIEALLRTSNSVIIAGDVNAKHTCWNSRSVNQAGVALLEMFEETDTPFGIIAPNEVTYIPHNENQQSDVLDIALVRNVNMNIQIRALNELSSDHSPVVLTLSGKLKEINKKVVLNYAHANWEQFQNDIIENLPNQQIENQEDLERSVQILTGIIQNAINENIPKKKINEHRPSITAEIKCLIRQRNDARRKWQRHRNPHHKVLMNRLKWDISQALQEHISNTWDNVLSELDTRNMSEVWNLTKRVMHVHTPLPPLIHNNHTAYTGEEKAAVFATCLRNTFTPNESHHNNHFIRETEQIVTNFMNTPNTTDIRNTSVGEVAWQIKHLKNRKAPGIDGIQNQVLKYLPLVAIRYLVNIINAMFRLKHFPHIWKEGRVLLFPKPKKDLSDPGNYRPITLLDTMSKIAEKILSKRLSHNLKTLNVLRNEQCGFRPKHSATAQLMRHVENISRGFNENRSTAALYLDIKQAFDKVWHDGLIRKMIELNLDDGIIRLVYHYLSNRRFHVNCENKHSDLKDIRSGVPQGSILGPTLFNIFINDIPHRSQYNNSNIHIFADDTLITGQSVKATHAANQIRRTIPLLEEWLTKWRVEINTDKCQAVLFTKKWSQLRILPPELIINGKAIPWKTEAKYLGVILDQKLLFRKHIDSLRAKAYAQLRNIFPLLNSTSKLNIRTSLTIYKALVRSIITYASPVWGHASKTHMSKLQKLQNRVLYTVTKLPRVTPIWTLHKETNMDTIQEYIATSAATFYESCNGHENPQIAELGRYDITHDKHKRPKSLLPQEMIEALGL